MRPAYQEKRYLAGRCIYCGQALAAGSTVYCLKHQALNRKRTREADAKRRILKVERLAARRKQE